MSPSLHHCKFGRNKLLYTGIASDPQAVPLLIGLGVAELSVSVPTIPGIKAQIRTLEMTECKRLAQQALELESATEVRALCPQRDE